MDATTRMQVATDEVRAFLEGYFETICSQDVDRITAHYTPDIVSYDAIGQLSFDGREAYAAHWKTCMEMCTAFTFAPKDLVVVADAGVAAAHCLVECGGTGHDGQEHIGWMRASIALRRAPEGWRIFHEHYSMPFDPESGRILGELAPQE